MPQATLGPLFSSFRCAVAYGIEGLGGAQAFIGDGLRCVGRSIRPNTLPTAPPPCDDRYTPRVTAPDFLTFSVLQEEKNHVRDVQLIRAQQQLTEATHRYYFIGLGGVACAVGEVALAVSCLMTFPWQILGVCLLLVSPKFISATFCQYDLLLQERERCQKKCQEWLGVLEELEARMLQLQSFGVQPSRSSTPTPDVLRRL